jgi:hypothetical protein
MEQKTEGYWYSEHTPEYPMPIANVLSEEEAQKIHDLITNIESDTCGYIKKLKYRGCSRSRITNEGLGSTEFSTNEWRWPCDFAPHYVLKHRVKPSDEFLTYIGY